MKWLLYFGLLCLGAMIGVICFGLIVSAGRADEFSNDMRSYMKGYADGLKEAIEMKKEKKND